ncbi:MAG: hypothetical protein FWG58_01335 [Methanomassiliicoccaceae archaeon]|nr:hypothetical protein [Methanomassiliicoccaceae archaeon]
MARRPRIIIPPPYEVEKTLQKSAMDDLIRTFQMERLQTRVGLSYKEARAYLIESYESTFTMADYFGTSLQAVYNLQRRAKSKVRKSGMTLEDIFGEHIPVKVARIVTRDFQNEPGRHKRIN